MNFLKAYLAFFIVVFEEHFFGEVENLTELHIRVAVSSDIHATLKALTSASFASKVELAVCNRAK